MEPISIGKHCRVSFIAAIGCAKIEWLGMPTSDEFRLGCNAVLNILKENGLSKVLVDNSAATLFTVADQRWLNEDWLPRAERLGYRYSATVLGNTDAFVKFAAQSIASKRDNSKFISKFFKTVDDAVEWLSSVN
ncbi:MAG: hypothetical protein RBT74_14640 [Tenuifilaceae bacterium]|jgi:hypothetical protein|nr:hypothetical protein [Tenuifilaceae bacterium]